MKFSNLVPTVLAAGLVASLSGCLKDSNTTQPTSIGGSATPLYDLGNAATVVDQLGHNVILQTYLDLNTRIKVLNSACADLKAAPSQQKLDIAKQAWNDARIPWESTESFLIGPVDALGIDPQMDTWPLAVTDLQQVLHDQPNITADQVRQLDTNLRGFHTAEFLLFGDGVASNNKALAAFQTSEFNYLVAVTGVMAQHTTTLVQAWTEHFDPDNAQSPSFIDVFTLHAGAQETGFASLPQVLQTIIQDGMVAISGEVGDSKLATPLGADIASANASLVESQFSWNSLTDFHNNVESIVHLYTGSYGERTGLGISALVKQSNPELDAEIIQALADAEAKIAAIAGPDGQMPFTRAIKDPAARLRVQDAIDQMHVLHRLLQDQLVKLVN